jgi:excisionase family DNA binding protein
MNPDPIMTIEEVAADLRCSMPHVYKAIKGKVAGVSALPAIAMGRKKLVRRSALERWKRTNERGGAIVDTVAEVNAV